MKIVILYSGGLDSLIMKHLAQHDYPDAEIKCVYYMHGADSEKSEIKSLPSFVEVRRLDWLTDTHRPVSKKSDPIAGPIYIPGRNLVFTVLAACQELPDLIWLGPLIDETNEQATDKNYHFLGLANEAISYTLSPFTESIEIEFPLADCGFTKETALRWALSTGLSAEIAKSTISCWHHGGQMSCGECKQCFKRHMVFYLNGIDDSDQYWIHPFTSPSGKRFIEQYTSVESPNEDELVVIDMISRTMNLRNEQA